MKFDKNIPIPPKKFKYDWSNMEVGDSLYVDVPSEADSAAQCLRKYIKDNKLNWDVTVRKENSGKRIWRIL